MDFLDRALGSNIPYITYAVPFFFLLIGLEVLAARWEHKRVYRLNDSINDLSCGILQTITGAFAATLLLFGYITVYEFSTSHGWNLVDVERLSTAGRWLAAIGLFLGVDFCYYWFHRASHEMNAPWAAHAVHHQSEEYNLAVALRQGTFQPFFSWAFYLPLALLGFPPLWFVAVSSFDTLYQFWIHTRLVGKLGPLEWVLNTPSHHRVHHGRNVKYLDKNHAGTLIIWDRMFGTFQAEEEEPVYGIVRPLSSWNPFWANVHEYIELWEVARSAPHWFDKVKIWFMPPGWQPRGLPPRPDTPDVQADKVIKYDTRVPASLALYVLPHFVVVLVLATSVLEAAKRVPLVSLVLPTVVVLLGLAAFGGLFERQRWAWWAELVRLPLGVAALTVAFAGSERQALVVGVASFVAAASAIYLWGMRAHFTPEARAKAIVAAQNLALTGDATDNLPRVVPAPMMKSGEHLAHAAPHFEVEGTAIG